MRRQKRCRLRFVRLTYKLTPKAPDTGGFWVLYTVLFFGETYFIFSKSKPVFMNWFKNTPFEPAVFIFS